MGEPARNLRMVELNDAPPAVVGTVPATSVTELNVWLPESGGINARIVNTTMCSTFANQPPPVRMTHLLPGRNASPTRGMKKRCSWFHNGTEPSCPTFAG